MLAALAMLLTISSHYAFPASRATDDAAPPAGKSAREHRKTTLPDGSTIQVVERVDVAIDPDREFHGPAVCRAPNGDLVLFHQDSLYHSGGDGQVRQWRSRDKGFTWRDEGVAVKWSAKGYDSLFGECATAPDGKTLVLVVQRRHAQKAGSGDAAIAASVWYTSADNGKTWTLKGEMDPANTYNCMYVRGLARLPCFPPTAA